MSYKNRLHFVCCHTLDTIPIRWVSIRLGHPSRGAFYVLVIIYVYDIHNSEADLAKKRFFAAVFSISNMNMTNVCCAKKRVGHALYMPQDGY